MPATTLRGYRDEFDDYLPHEGEGRFRRYSEECIQVLSNIKQMKQNGLSKEEFETALGTRTITTTTTAATRTPQEELLVQLQQYSQRVNSQLVEITERQEETLKAIQKLQELQAEKKWFEFWK